MRNLSTGVSDPLRLLRDVKQFLFFIEHRLRLCESAHDALEILPDVDAALSRLDQAIAQIPPEGERAASANLTRPVRRAPKASSGPLGRA
jgi:hypothetical protein